MVMDFDLITPLFSRYGWAVRYKTETSVDFAAFVTYKDALTFKEAIDPHNTGSYEIVEIDHTSTEDE